MLIQNLPAISAKSEEALPTHFIYEVMDGKPLYYKGYREVLAGTKTFSQVIGSSSLQSFIIAYLQRLLFTQLDENSFIILSSETGLHLGKNDNLAGDILIFEATALPIGAINEQYVSVPPKIVVEVDIDIDTTDTSSDSYLYQKTQKLLDFGVEKVIWILTDPRKVLVATQEEDWQVKNWHKEVEILAGLTCNIGQYLLQKGSSFA